MATSVMLPMPHDPFENISWKVKVSTGFGFAVATLGLVLRLIARWLSGTRLALTDWLIIAAYCPKLGIDISSLVLIHYGIGRHIQAVPVPYLTEYLKTLYVGSFVYAPCIALIKLSILALYKSAFTGPKYFIWSIYFFAGAVTAWGIACCLVGLLACVPIHKSWTPGIPGHCIDLVKYYWGLQLPNIVTDFALLFLPVFGIWLMRDVFGKTRAIQVGAVFALGLVTCIFDVIRLVVMLQLKNSPDITWNQVSASVWTDVEPSMAFLVACLPFMRPLWSPNKFWHAHHGDEKEQAEAPVAKPETELTSFQDGEPPIRPHTE